MVMESYYCLPNPKAKLHHFSSLPSNYFLPPIFKISSFQPSSYVKSRKLSKLKCVRRSSISKLEWKTKDDEMMDMEKELIGIMRMEGGKCKEGSGGIVELLECLEREAIMGEDEGKEPKDYNRRAEIFDKSSRVFQQLKGK